MDNIHPPNISNAFSIKKNVIFCLYLTEETLGNGNLTTKDPHVPPVLMPVKTNSAVSKIYYDKTHYCLWQKKVYFFICICYFSQPLSLHKPLHQLSNFGKYNWVPKSAGVCLVPCFMQMFKRNHSNREKIESVN